MVNELYFSGTSGILLPFKNQSFYPERFIGQSRLQVYSQIYNSLEINSSFYKLPLAKTVNRWANEVTDQFRFTFKMLKQITHVTGFDFDMLLVRKFMEIIEAVDHKKGCVLIQLPPSISIKYLQKLATLLEATQSCNNDGAWRICVEFRHASWHDAKTFRMLDENNAGMVFQDKEGNGINLEETNANFIYLRFHGPNGDYKESYDDIILSEYGGYVKDWLDEEKEVYVYFNNTIGEALNNLDLLNKHVSQKID